MVVLTLHLLYLHLCIGTLQAREGGASVNVGYYMFANALLVNHNMIAALMSKETGFR